MTNILVTQANLGSKMELFVIDSQYREPYSGLSQTYKMKRFSKMING